MECKHWFTAFKLLVIYIERWPWPSMRWNEHIRNDLCHLDKRVYDCQVWLVPYTYPDGERFAWLFSLEDIITK